MADARESSWTDNRWEGFIVGVAAGITTTFVAFVVVLSFGWFGVGGTSDASAAPTTTAPSGPQSGEDVALLGGCTACHSTDGSELVGPSWRGVAGTDRPVEGGGTVFADSAYLHESIVSPSVILVAGFNDVMPKHFGDSLSLEQIEALVTYIESLG